MWTGEISYASLDTGEQPKDGLVRWDGTYLGSAQPYLEGQEPQGGGKSQEGFVLAVFPISGPAEPFASCRARSPPRKQERDASCIVAVFGAKLLAQGALLAAYHRPIH